MDEGRLEKQGETFGSTEFENEGVQDKQENLPEKGRKNPRRPPGASWRTLSTSVIPSTRRARHKRIDPGWARELLLPQAMTSYQGRQAAAPPKESFNKQKIRMEGTVDRMNWGKEAESTEAEPLFQICSRRTDGRRKQHFMDRMQCVAESWPSAAPFRNRQKMN